MIVTISREMGAGGSVAAARVARALGWQLVDNEMVGRVAARSGMSPAEVREREERAPGFVDRLVRLLTKAAPEIFPAPADEVPELEEARLVKITETVVTDLARQGRVVLVGRAAPVVLRQERDALHVKLVAPRAGRIETVATREQVARSEAEAMVRESDENRKRYHRLYYDTDWNDSANYHMVLNSGRLGLDQAVAIIVAEASRRWGLRAGSGE